jgi:transcriptional regulator with XRE-family HTH domain
MTPDRFRAIRTSLGLSQVELAAALGYRHTSQISWFETGHRPVPHLLALLLEAWWVMGRVPERLDD